MRVKEAIALRYWHSVLSYFAQDETSDIFCSAVKSPSVQRSLNKNTKDEYTVIFFNLELLFEITKANDHHNFSEK